MNKQSLINFFYPLLDTLLPLSFAEKIKIIGCVLLNPWHILPPRSPMFAAENFADVTDEKITQTYAEFPEKTISLLQEYVRRIRIFAKFPYPPGSLLFNYEHLMSAEELEEFSAIQKETIADSQKLHFRVNGKYMWVPEAFYYHHGLRFAPLEIKDYIKGKIFIDAGAGFGDSALVFLKYYAPAKVYSFEPSESNRELCLKHFKKNAISKEKYDLCAIGLGEIPGELHLTDNGGLGFMLKSEEAANSETITIPIDTIDNLFSNKTDKIGLIKADVEGMCLEMVRGAEKIIKRDLPVLSLGIYHNQEELLGVYSYLKSLNLNYKYQIQSLSPKVESIELTLLAFPDIIQKTDNKNI